MSPCHYLLVLLFISCAYSTKKQPSANEYDTYNADECRRVRRPWHTLSTEERALYISGLLQLRKKANGDIEHDELLNIGSVHEDEYSPFIHKTSAYLFWHGYFVWELESRIRNLGGKYRCFGMPYWDFTLEYGRESNPLLFEGGEIGGDGDPNNEWAVNEYSWSPTTKEYFVPNNCFAANDHYPVCSLKRSLRDPFIMPSPPAIGAAIIENPNFMDFASYSHLSGQAIHLIDDHPEYMEPFPQSYEPVWYLFHSFIQYHQAIWVDCNDYDLIDADDLDQHPEAFEPFCNSEGRCDTVMGWDLDSPMYFGGALVDQEWSYIHSHNLTARKLYMLPKWNIIYDLEDGDGFYSTSGLSQYCKGKLNKDWFILNGRKQQRNGRILPVQFTLFHTVPSSMLIVALMLICVGSVLLCSYTRPKRVKMYDVKRTAPYGSV
eukprot:295864_1